MSTQMELPLESKGEAPRGERSEEGPTATNGDERSGASDLTELSSHKAMMERAVNPSNLQAALRRVKQNKGSPGIDGMTVKELPEHLAEHWEKIRRELLGGTYAPRPVRRHLIPKSDGGVRELGIPTVLDRFIQQALLQVLQPRFDGTFSPYSYGFRPGRNAHQAILQAESYIREGRRWVVDIDLEKFFDRVNHDVLMGRLAKRIEDKRVLGLIRRYLEAGVMADGVVMEKEEGTPQGGPLSPLLANILLDEVDKELERRGHAFVRYADDCNVYVRSKRAGERVKEALQSLYAGLKLRINEEKSAVARVWTRKLLGYGFWVDSKKEVRRRVAKKALETMKEKVRKITARTRGRSMKQVIGELQDYLPGWKEYFRLAETPRVFRRLDSWVRHRLRTLQLHQWRRGKKAFEEFRKLGASKRVAAKAAFRINRWWKSGALAIHMVLTEHYFDQLGVPRLELK
jgi:group II intron reverse transcriptase/maturase